MSAPTPPFQTRWQAKAGVVMAATGLVLLEVAYSATAQIVHTAAMGQTVARSAFIWMDVAYLAGLLCGIGGIVLGCLGNRGDRSNPCGTVAIWIGVLDVAIPFLIVV